MIEFGKVYVFQMDRIESQGLVLTDSNQEEEIWVKPSLEFPFTKGKRVPVFAWMRGEDGQNWGSLKLPPLELGQVDFLRISSKTFIGVFLDWGLEKDLFCPLSHTIGEPAVDMIVPVRLLLDDKTNRLMGSMKWKKTTQPATDDFYRSMEVDLLVMEPSETGYVVLVNNDFLGMIYENQRFKNLRVGQKTKGYVNKVRDDGKIDILLQRPGYGEVLDASGQLLAAIQKAGGRLQLGDKSEPEEIINQLNMSKKVFKKSAGALYKSGKIGMSEKSIWLVENDGD